MNQPQLTRTELYGLIWLKPATRIAEEFGVTPAAVFAACHKLNVPRPGRGHWVRLEFGKGDERPPLPPLPGSGPESVELTARRARPSRVEEPSPASETTPAQTTPPETNPSAPLEDHPVVKETRAAYRGGSKDPKHGTTNPKPDHPHVWVFATSGALDRAFSLLNQLLWMLERNGFTFRIDEKTHMYRAVFVATDSALDFSIQEVIEPDKSEPTPEEKRQPYFFRRWRYIATGRLRFILSEYHPQGAQKSWGDGKNIKLDTKLTDIVEGCLICAKGKHVQQTAWRERERQWAEAARLREEQERLRKEETARRTAFRTAAQHWTEAQALRDFHAACEEGLKAQRPDGALNDRDQRWLDWGMALIRSVDPLTAGYLEKGVAEFPTCEVGQVGPAMAGGQTAASHSS